MDVIASIKGKLYRLQELTPQQAADLSAANGYDDLARFITRHENWMSTLTQALRVIDSAPIALPRTPKPTLKKITPLKRSETKRSSKYGFDVMETVGDRVFIEEGVAKMAAAASYYGNNCKPVRKFIVNHGFVDGKLGAVIERTA